MKLPNPEKNQVFVMRISTKHKQLLEQLAKSGKYGNNSSEVIRSLILNAHRKSI